jgi:hypothetical protein
MPNFLAASVTLNFRDTEGRRLLGDLLAASGTGGGIVLTNAGQDWLAYVELPRHAGHLIRRGKRRPRLTETGGLTDLQRDILRGPRVHRRRDHPGGQRTALWDRPGCGPALILGEQAGSSQDKPGCRDLGGTGIT